MCSSQETGSSSLRTAVAAVAAVLDIRYYLRSLLPDILVHAAVAAAGVTVALGVALAAPAVAAPAEVARRFALYYPLPD